MKLNLKSGDILNIQDLGALQISQQSGAGLKPLEYTILDVKDWVTLNLKKEDCLTYRFVELSDNSLLIEKNIKGESNFYIYQDTGFPIKNRAENLDSGEFWIFDGVDANNARNKPIIEHSFAKDVIETKPNSEIIRYVQKSFGEITLISKPNIASLVEYQKDNGENSEALIFEFGNLSTYDAAGGTIILYTGRQLNLEDITVFPK